MEALLIEYAKRYGMEKALQMLGLDKQTQNPKYAISLGGININPKSMLMRAGFNKVMGGSIGSMLGPAALMGGAFMLGKAFDPLNPNSRNYNPSLKGQIDYLNFNNMIGRNQNMGSLQYGPDSVLRGKNVISMFGTNDYEKQLDNKIDWFEDRIKKGKSYSKKIYEKAKQEQANLNDYNVQKTIEKNQVRNLQNINAGGNGRGMQTSGFSNVDGGPVSNRTGRGRQGYGRGGIANL